MFPSLNESQLNKLSDIVSEIAVVSLASVVLPAVFEKPNFIIIGLGLIVTTFFWSLSLWILKNK